MEWRDARDELEIVWCGICGCQCGDSRERDPPDLFYSFI